MAIFNSYVSHNQRVTIKNQRWMFFCPQLFGPFHWWLRPNGDGSMVLEYLPTKLGDFGQGQIDRCAYSSTMDPSWEW